jgi:hypothetical protein
MIGSRSECEGRGRGSRCSHGQHLAGSEVARRQSIHGGAIDVRPADARAAFNDLCGRMNIGQTRHDRACGATRHPRARGGGGQGRADGDRARERGKSFTRVSAQRKRVPLCACHERNLGVLLPWASMSSEAHQYGQLRPVGRAGGGASHLDLERLRGLDATGERKQ